MNSPDWWPRCHGFRMINAGGISMRHGFSKRQLLQLFRGRHFHLKFRDMFTDHLVNFRFVRHVDDKHLRRCYSIAQGTSAPNAPDQVDLHLGHFTITQMPVLGFLVYYNFSNCQQHYHCRTAASIFTCANNTRCDLILPATSRSAGTLCSQIIRIRTAQAANRGAHPHPDVRAKNLLTVCRTFRYEWTPSP